MNRDRRFRGDHKFILPLPRKFEPSEREAFEAEILDRLRPPNQGTPSFFADWFDPPYEIRVFLVASIWAIPGFLVTLMVQLWIPLHDPPVAAVVGALMSALVGGCLEKK